MKMMEELNWTNKTLCDQIPSDAERYRVLVRGLLCADALEVYGQETRPIPQGVQMKLHHVSRWMADNKVAVAIFSNEDVVAVLENLDIERCSDGQGFYRVYQYRGLSKEGLADFQDELERSPLPIPSGVGCVATLY
jgi:hypothetical protein